MGDAMGSHPEDEVRAALDAYLALRQRIEDGEATWTDLADLFTDDVVYVDPAWGRLEGIEELRVFLDESMRGLEDWSFPVELTAIDTENVQALKDHNIPIVEADDAFIAELQSQVADLKAAWVEKAKAKGVDGEAVLKALQEEVETVRKELGQ